MMVCKYSCVAVYSPSLLFFCTRLLPATALASCGVSGASAFHQYWCARGMRWISHGFSRRVTAHNVTLCYTMYSYVRQKLPTAWGLAKRVNDLNKLILASLRNHRHATISLA